MRTATLITALSIDAQNAPCGKPARPPHPDKPGHPWFRWPEKAVVFSITGIFLVGLILALTRGVDPTIIGRIEDFMTGFSLLFLMSLHGIFMAWIIMRVIYFVPLIWHAVFEPPLI